MEGQVTLYCVKCGSGNIVDDWDRDERRDPIRIRKCLSCGGRRIEEPRHFEVTKEPEQIIHIIHEEEYDMARYCKNFPTKHPETKKFAVRDGLCSNCFKEEKGMGVRQAMTADRLAARGNGNTPTAPKPPKPPHKTPTLTHEGVRATAPLKADKTILIDFAQYPQLFEALGESAKEYFRTLEGQVFAYIALGLYAEQVRAEKVDKEA